MTRWMPVSVPERADPPTGMRRIAVGVGSHPQACDADLLADVIARATGAELTMVAVRPPVPAGVLREIGETEAEVETRLRVMAPGARLAVETDRSVASGLARVVARERADLLVVGSSRHAPEGQVRIGQRTRRLLVAPRCQLAVAPRGLCSRGLERLTVIGVGYDGTAESGEALSRAQSLGRLAGARLRVRAVVDDRLPYVGWTPTAGPDVNEIWDMVIEPGVESLLESAEHAVSATGADAVIEAGPGSPADELIAFSHEVDLLVIGLRRSGAFAEVPLGPTGKEVLHRAGCSVMVVPPPSRSPTPRPAAA